MKRGRVILVGAGPGAPDLVTVRGAEALRGADAVVYDALAPEALLALAPPDALRIDVGKRGHDAPTLSQDDTSALLVRLAAEGRTVVRLKGADPYVFGRGSEEASACARAGIPFEVVPGVSSLFGALAYAGIPITDRRHSASFAVTTGHKDPSKPARETRWDLLAQAADTLVVLMGARNLEEIAGRLLASGRSPATPAAVVMDGTLPSQRVVEAPLGELARRAREAGVVYSLAYGDQPALICELVDWARAAGFEVVAAGKGTKYLPAYHDSTPDTVWGHYGFTAQQVANGDFNAQMFNSFLDGTKSAIEMAAVANATGLTPAPEGLAFPPCGVDDLPQLLRPRAEGGLLHHRGQVEVVSSLERDGRPVSRDLRWGVYVTLAADSEYVRRCFHEYGLATDETGNYAAMYKPYHLIGLELGITVASIGLRGEATGQPSGFRGDAVAVAKRDLREGETLDGEGGRTVWGRLMPARESVRRGALPIGLAQGGMLSRAVAKGEVVRWRDVVVPDSEAARVRREMEALPAR